MTKGSTPRHSKPSKPVTIDLDATDVTPKEKPGAAAQGVDQTAAKAVETGNPAKTASPSVQSGGAAKPAAAAPENASTSGKEKPAAAASPTGPKTGSGAARSDQAKSEPAGAESVKAGGAAAGASGSSSPTGGASSGKSGAAAAAKASPSAAPAASSATSGAADGKSGRGGLGMVASGVIGAVLALGGGYALQVGGVLPAPGAISGAANEAEQTQVVSDRVDELAAQLEGLVAELSAQPAGASGGTAAELISRIEALEAASSSEGASGSDAGQTATLTTRIDEIEARLETVAESAATTQTGSDPALSATVAELQASQAGVTDALSQSRTDAEALASRISALDGAQTELAERLDERMAMLETRLDEPAQQVDLARAIAAAGLKTAIDRGGSFMSELEAFASVAPDDPAVPELRDLAARGVPSRSELIEGFPDAANLAIAAEAPADPEAGLVDRLMNSALSVVKVRQVGEIEGDTAEATAARAEARLLDGDLEAALTEWNALPEASRAAAADFGDALAARARAEKLVAASLTSGGTTQTGPAEAGSALTEPLAPAPEAAADAASDTSPEAPAN